MQIEQLSRITGVSVSAIRHYGQIGLLPTTDSIDGHNHYVESHVHAIKLIKMAQSIGLSLREIITILRSKDAVQSSNKIKFALKRLAEHHKTTHPPAAEKPTANDSETFRNINSLRKQLEVLFQH